MNNRRRMRNRAIMGLIWQQNQRMNVLGFRLIPCSSEEHACGALYTRAADMLVKTFEAMTRG